MWTFRLLSTAFLILWTSLAWADEPKIARKIVKMPAFKQKTQQYALILLGQKPHREIWVVRDGYDYYVDRNGNGDLTEPDEKVTFPKTRPDEVEHFLDVGMITDAHGVSHGPLIVHLQSGALSGYGDLTLTVAKKFKQGATGFPTGKSPETAPVFHFDGPITPGFQVRKKMERVPASADDLALSRSMKRNFTAWAGTQIKGWGQVYTRPLPPTDEKDEKRPVLEITYDNRDPKGPPIVESFRMEEKSHYTFGGAATAPKNAGAKAKLKLTFPALPDVPAYEIEVKVGD